MDRVPRRLLAPRPRRQQLNHLVDQARYALFALSRPKGTSNRSRRHRGERTSRREDWRLPDGAPLLDEATSALIRTLRRGVGTRLSGPPCGYERTPLRPTLTRRSAAATSVGTFSRYLSW